MGDAVLFAAKATRVSPLWPVPNPGSLFSGTGHLQPVLTGPACMPRCPLQGVEAFHCERCGEKTPATKHLRIHRFPEVLVLQIKRFKYKASPWPALFAVPRPAVPCSDCLPECSTNGASRLQRLRTRGRACGGAAAAAGLC